MELAELYQALGRMFAGQPLTVIKDRLVDCPTNLTIIRGTEDETKIYVDEDNNIVKMEYISGEKV